MPDDVLMTCLEAGCERKVVWREGFGWLHAMVGPVFPPEDRSGHGARGSFFPEDELAPSHPVRPTCERCRRPDVTDVPSQRECNRYYSCSRDDCDRLLLERADRDEELLAQTVRDCEALDAKVAALAAAGDALAAWVDGLDLRHRAPGELHRWRTLRSPKGASNGD